MYAKLFSTITESSLWSEPKEVRLLFVTMLAKADQTGFVDASIPGLARVANLTIEETSTALECLESPDPYSKNPDNDGRRVLRVPGGFMLLNYEDYRARRNAEERQEYMKKYMQDYRRQRKQDVNDVNNSVNAVNNSVNDVNDVNPVLTTVSRSKPPLAQAEAEAEAELNTKSARAAKKREIPTAEEVRAYCSERRSSVDPDQFFDYYETNGWTQGRGKPIRDWQAAVRTWERNGINQRTQSKPLPKFGANL